MCILLLHIDCIRNLNLSNFLSYTYSVARQPQREYRNKQVCRIGNVFNRESKLSAKRDLGNRFMYLAGYVYTFLYVYNRNPLGSAKGKTRCRSGRNPLGSAECKTRSRSGRPDHFIGKRHGRDYARSQTILNNHSPRYGLKRVWKLKCMNLSLTV